MRKLMLVLLLAAVCGAGQNLDTLKTHGSLNGRYWESLADQAKIDFVVGYGEGVQSAQVLPFGALAIDKCTLDDEGNRSLRDMFQLLFPLSTIYGDVLKGLDRLYAEPENLPLPISSAMRVLAMKFRSMYRQMRDLFTSKMHLAEPSTREHFAALVEFIEMWDRFFTESLPREVLGRIRADEEKLRPLYADLTANFDRLQTALKK